MLIDCFNILATGLEPFVIPLLIAGTAVTAVSAIRQGKEARQQAEFQAAIAERNARLAERQAEAEQQAALETAKVQEREGRRLLARQRAGFAVAGVQISRGTPLSVVVETAAELKAEELTILREGRISAAQRRGEADIFRLTGEAAKQRGRAAGRAATLAAAGSILTGISAVGIARSGKFVFRRGLPSPR